MHWWTIVVGLLLVGCGSGNEAVPESPFEEPDRIAITNQALPPGVVGEAYAASLGASGGQPPLTFDTDPDFRLPIGLSLAPDGAIAGVPAEAGTHDTLFVVRDGAGQEQRFIATFEIDLVPELIDCGDVLEGEFTGNAMRSSGPIWEAVTTPNLQWLGIPWPQGDNQRVQITVDAETTVGILVQRPNQPEGSIDWREDYVGTWIGQGSGTSVTLDPSTLPSLPTFEAQGLVPLLMVSFGESAYRLEVQCSDGPIFEQTLPFPVRLGEEFSIDFDVYGDNSDITFTIDGDLPDWVTVDEAEGTLSGTAIEEVTVPLDLTATTSDGRSRSATSIFGVYDPKPIACGESVDVVLEQGYYDGPVGGYYDPRGYRVFQLDVPNGLSAIEWTVDGLDGQYISLVDHDEDRYFFFGGADSEFSSSGPAVLGVTPRSYPAVRHYRDAGTMYVITAVTGVNRAITVTPTCDAGPRLDAAGLPVVQPLVTIDAPLRGTGGAGPYEFAATGLPSGLSVSGSRLTGNTTAVGRHEVELTVTDALGASFVDTFDLFVGLDEACDGGLRVECDQVLEGRFSGAFFDGAGPRAEEHLCFYGDGVGAVGFEFSSDGGEYRVDVGDPGVRGSTFLEDADALNYAGVVYEDDIEALALNPFSWPALPDYEGLPVHIGLRALEPGEWRVAVVCEIPQP